jgi:mono/diheme cytochrome c family protein
VIKRTLLGLAVIYLAGITFANAEDWKLPANEPTLKPAPGSAFVTANCQICHSVDYISTQPPLDRSKWTAIVQKMRDKYGSPLPADKVDEVVDYIAANDGKK